MSKTRWRIAYALNRLPRTCWANLVSWALGGSDYSLLPRTQDRQHVWQNRLCRGDDTTRNGQCYCGKVRYRVPAPEAEA